MENASKALIIAGAILIALLLISVGIMIFNSSSGLFGSATAKMSEQEKSMFNQEYLMYEGKRVSGSQVAELIRKVDANNANESENPHININITKDEIKNAYQYEVKCDTDGSGVISDITVKRIGETKKQ